MHLDIYTPNQKNVFSPQPSPSIKLTPLSFEEGKQMGRPSFLRENTTRPSVFVSPTFQANSYFNKDFNI